MNDKKLLIVDDDRDLLVGLSTRLRAQGYKVVTAPDAVTAISTAIKEKPELIILDIGLPAGDGFAVLRRLRSLTSHATTPIIVLTARDPVTHRPRALQEGATAFFQKPADNTELLTAIRTALGETPPSATTA